MFRTTKSNEISLQSQNQMKLVYKAQMPNHPEFN